MGTVRTFLKVGTCSETLCNVIDRAFNNPLELEEHASMPFAGGILQHGYQCGLIWGAALAAGAQAHRLYGSGPKAEAGAVIATQRLVDSFRERNKNINCHDITDLDKSSSAIKQIFYFLIKGGSIGCFRMAANYDPQAYNEIQSALSGTIEAPSTTASCAAELARRMGASDEHVVMSAGFAGGIGLCGGACGVLGAAIWLTSMKTGREQGGKIDYKDPRGLEIVEKFLKYSDYKFECSDIVGRRFENVDDHAAYLRKGDCSNIIEAMAAE